MSNIVNEKIVPVPCKIVWGEESGDYIAIENWGNGGARLLHTLCNEKIDEEDALPSDRSKWTVAVDALTSLILNQACAGIDVHTDAYKEAVQETIEYLVGEYDDELDDISNMQAFETDLDS